MSFDQRRKSYQRDFGEHLAGFEVIAVVRLDEIDEAEDIAKKALDEHRIREYTIPDGNTYTQSTFEWCRSICREEVVTKILRALAANGTPHQPVLQIREE